MSKPKSLRSRTDLGVVVGRILKFHRDCDFADEMDEGFGAPSECFAGRQHDRWSTVKRICRKHGYKSPRLVMRAVEQRMGKRGYRVYELTTAILCAPGVSRKSAVRRAIHGPSRAEIMGLA